MRRSTSSTGRRRRITSAIAATISALLMCSLPLEGAASASEGPEIKIVESGQDLAEALEVALHGETADVVDANARFLGAGSTAGLNFVALTSTQAEAIMASVPYLSGRSPDGRSVVASNLVTAVTDVYVDDESVTNVQNFRTLDGEPIIGLPQIVAKTTSSTSDTVSGVVTRAGSIAQPFSFSIAAANGGAGCKAEVEDTCDRGSALMFGLSETTCPAIPFSLIAAWTCLVSTLGGVATDTMVCNFILCASVNRDVLYRSAVCTTGSCSQFIDAIDRQTMRRPYYAALYTIYHYLQQRSINYKTYTVPNQGCDPTGIMCSYSHEDLYGSNSVKQQAKLVEFLAFVNWDQSSYCGGCEYQASDAFVKAT